MKASIEWLNEYTDIDVTALELADILTLTGSKVENVESKGNDIKNVVVGKILEIEKHPDANKLVITKVNVKDEILQIVTGANNIKVNDIVPIAKDGAELPGGTKIKNGKLRGIDSCGMMCSIGELGLDINMYPNQIEHGIMILPSEYEEYLGKEIVDVLNLKEDIIEFEITPNRPDCLSIEGLGRETAISLKKQFKNPRKNLETAIEVKNEIDGLKVDIEAPDLCYRYVSRIVKDVVVKPSPEWMVRRLNACGIRSINNVVDITNYVMIELGQPMHAFDINSIEGKHIVVRRAKDGEEITTLDEQQRILNSNMLVISDEKKAVAIAGVMGGLNSEIEETTKTVVFESAVFYGGNVRKTAKAVGLRTDASARYEKGLSPENAMRVVNRAVELMEQLGAGKAEDGVIDVYPTKQKENKIKFGAKRINKLLGTNIPEEEMLNILKKLEMKLDGEYIIPPYYRADVEGIADLAEEIIRFYGYDKLGTTLIYAESTSGGKNKKQKIEDNLRELLMNKGFSEIYTYGFINKKELEKINVDSNSEIYAQSIKLQNPLSDDYAIMRTTTVQSMMQTLSNNYNKKNKDVNLFDISKIYKNDKKQIENAELPTEELILTIGMYGENVDFYNLKGIVENVLSQAGIQKYDIEKEQNNTMYHPGRTAIAKVGIDTIATFGEIHPIVIQNYGINQRVYIAEINIDKIIKYARVDKKYTPIPKYPAVERDIAIIIDENIEVGQIEKVILKKSKKVLESINLFDIYRNEKIGENKKSVAYALKFRDPNKTLNDEEINTIMNSIIEELEKSFDAELRK